MARTPLGTFPLILLLVAAFASVTSVALGGDDATLKKRARQPLRSAEDALQLGNDLRRAGLFTLGARVLARAALRARGRDASRLRYARARLLIAARRQKAAMAECRQLRRLSFVKGQACISEAQLLWRRASVAVPEAKKALDRSANDYDALIAYGRALRQLGKPAEAERRLRRAVQVEPSRYEAHWALGRLLMATGREAEGIASLRRAHGLAAREPVLAFDLAKALGAGPEAIGLLRAAVATRARYGGAHALLGELLLDEGKVRDAEKALRAAVGIDGKKADWQASLGRVLLAKGDNGAALKSARAALKLVGNHAVAKLVEADALAARGDIDLAIEAYERAHGLARGDPGPLVHAARASLKGGRPTTARAFADRAVQEFSSWGPGWVALGDILAAANENEAARKAYGKALRRSMKGRIDAAEVRRKLAAIQ